MAALDVGAHIVVAKAAAFRRLIEIKARDQRLVIVSFETWEAMPCPLSLCSRD